jgi:hypothetical protein
MAVQVSVSTRGILAGGIVGAILRPLALHLQIGEEFAGESTQMLLVISSMIGFVAGGAAGAIGRPVWSALTGAVLAGAAYFFTIVPLTFCLCLGSLERSQAGDEPPVWWLMAATGALAGLAGGVAEIAGRPRSTTAHQDEVKDTAPPAEPPAEL